jgi:pimeloyl-ACP methyl ester carboxylesterase
MGRRPGPCRNVLIVSDQPTRHWVELGAHRVSYLAAGSVDDPVVLLLHGLASDATTWLPAIEALSAHRLRVLAVDLLGHGGSDKPELPYSLTLFGDMVGDFLDALGLGAVTMAGHSLGGAVAMQLGYHQPERVARLVLVSSGGLGKQVHPMLRVASLPGAGQLLGLAVNRRTEHGVALTAAARTAEAVARAGGEPQPCRAEPGGPGGPRCVHNDVAVGH